MNSLIEELGQRVKRNDIVINLKLNSLEDAFINIGMDEEKFIKKA